MVEGQRWEGKISLCHIHLCVYSNYKFLEKKLFEKNYKSSSSSPIHMNQTYFYSNFKHYFKSCWVGMKTLPLFAKRLFNLYYSQLRSTHTKALQVINYQMRTLLLRTLPYSPEENRETPLTSASTRYLPTSNSSTSISGSVLMKEHLMFGRNLVLRTNSKRAPYLDRAGTPLRDSN